MFRLPYAAGMTSEQIALQRLLDVMAALRHPQTGCSWDLEQSFASIAPFTIEEAYEVADAIANDMAALPDELGDLLFQVVYLARLAEEAGRFDFAAVADAVTDKMIRRHPHIFGEANARDVPAQLVAWEAQKSAERAARQLGGALAGVAVGLPALTRAVKITARAARVGFDWPDAAAVLHKLAEETAELEAELPGANQARVADELGDMLFVIANLARKLEIDPEDCLRAATAKFQRRFEAIEAGLAEDGRMAAEAGLQQLEARWQAVKQKEGKGLPSPADAAGEAQLFEA